MSGKLDWEKENRELRARRKAATFDYEWGTRNDEGGHWIPLAEREDHAFAVALKYEATLAERALQELEKLIRLCRERPMDQRRAFLRDSKKRVRRLLRSLARSRTPKATRLVHDAKVLFELNDSP